MALVHCRECGREISDRAVACPGCGYPMDRGDASRPARGFPFGYVYEYKSPKTILGLPLVHIVYGPVWGGGFKPAKGFIAIGNVAIGVFAFGGFAAGLFTMAGIGLGFVCLAGLALGIGVGIGGAATGWLAIGGIALGHYAVGGLAIGAHTILNDPHIRDFFRRLFPS